MGSHPLISKASSDLLPTCTLRSIMSERKKGEGLISHGLQLFRVYLANHIRVLGLTLMIRYEDASDNGASMHNRPDSLVNAHRLIHPSL